MKEKYLPLLILEFIILYCLNSFIQAYIQYILNVTTYGSFLFLFIPIGLSLIMILIFIFFKGFQPYLDKIELIFHIFVIFTSYFLVTFHISTPILPSNELIKVPFILWLIYSFFLGCSCILSVINSSKRMPANTENSSFIINGMLFFIFFGITITILRFFNNALFFFAYSSIIHLIYITVLRLDKFSKDDSIRLKKYSMTRESVDKIHYFKRVVKFIDFVFILSCFIIAWYQSGYIFRENMTLGIEGRIKSAITVWNSVLCILGFGLGICVDLFQNQKIKKDVSMHNLIGFGLSISTILWNPNISLILLGYLIAIITLNLKVITPIGVGFALWFTFLINLAGYYVLFDFPFFSGLLGGGIENDLNLFRTIILVQFGLVGFLNILLWKYTKPKMEVEV